MLLLGMISCGSYVYQGGNNYSQIGKPNPIIEKFDLEVRVLKIEEIKSGQNNKIKVDYEVINNSELLFEKPKKRHNIFFTITTKSNKEIGHTERIYGRIPAGTSMIKKETIDLSIYEYASISASIYTD
ncbi:hypothetical protein [Aquimarina addita]